jgi:hypothetical protein
MQLNKAPSVDGYVWVRQGFWLFKKNPLAFLMLVFIYVFIAQFTILIPVFGVFAVLLLTPALTVGFMTACQMVIRGERVMPTVYLAGFRGTDPITKKNLLILGTIYAFAILILSLIASAFIDFKQLVTLLTQQQPPDHQRCPRSLFGAQYWLASLFASGHGDVVCANLGGLGKNVSGSSAFFKLDCLLDQ